MNSDIVDEIELYLRKYRRDEKSASYIQIQSEAIGEVEIVPGFNKSWCKLGLPEKLNRLMHYHKKIMQRNNMDQDKGDVMRKYFYENVNSTLASDEYVTYDQSLGEVITIIGLKYDGVGFYVDDCKKQKSQTEGIRIKHMPIFNLQELNKKLKSHSDIQVECLKAKNESESILKEIKIKSSSSDDEISKELNGSKKKIAIKLKVK